jgi:O-antigen/teichoic acid export membrane protein
LSSIKKLAGQTAVYGLSSVVGRLLNYLLTPLLTNFFLPAEYGINTEVYAYISFLNVVFTYGMETAYFRFCQEKDADKAKVFSTANISLLLSSAVFTMILLVVSPIINAKLHYEMHKEIMWCVAGILFFDTLVTIPFNRLRQENKPMQFAFFRLLNIGINILMVLYFIKVAPNLSCIFSYRTDIGISYVFIANLTASIITFLLMSKYWFGMKWAVDKVLLKRMLIYALPLLIVGLGGMVNETFDRILLNFLLPDESTAKAQIGIYGACYKISLIITMFVQAFRMGAEPFFFNHANNENAKEIYARVMQVFVAACLLIVFGTMIFIDEVKYFVGSQYREGLQVVPILLWANVCLGIYYNLTIWYKLTNQTIMGTYITLGGAAITLILNFMLIPKIGYVGSAWATLACYAAMMIASYLLGQKYYPVNYPLKNIFKQFFLLLILYVIATVLVQSTYFHVGIFKMHSIIGILILLVLMAVGVFTSWKMNKEVIHHSST